MSNAPMISTSSPGPGIVPGHYHPYAVHVECLPIRQAPVAKPKPDQTEYSTGGLTLRYSKKKPVKSTKAGARSRRTQSMFYIASVYGQSA